MHLRDTLSLALVALAALAPAGCGGGGGERITVYAAASLTDVLEEIAPGARYNFAGSDELATQIREGAQADVYAAASPRYAQELAAEGLVDAPSTFATNRLVVVVPEGTTLVRSVADLRRPGVKLVIGAEGVPVGDYAREALARMEALDVLERVVSEEEDTRSVLGKVALGEADAGFVYATDVAAARDDVRAIELPRAARTVVEYQVAILRSSGHRVSAESFVALLLDRQGRARLRAAGFGLP